MNVQVGIVYGSPNDETTMNKAVAVLERFGVGCEQESMSAHRMPGRVHEYISGAEDRGLKVIIAGAGLAAHLAGVCASLTTLPVIAVPLSGGIAEGLDALLSSVQMPPGVPVATVAVNGAANAGLLAVQIIALGDEGLRKKLHELKADLANGGRL